MNLFFDIPSIYIYLLIPAAIAAMAVKPRNRYLLLRVLIYLLIFMILLSPYLKFHKTASKKPTVGVYIDKSLSMSIAGRGEETQETAAKIKKIIGQKVDLNYFTFSSDIKEVEFNDILAIPPDGTVTDLSEVIRDTRHNAKIIVTDGRYNQGRNPLAVNEITSVPLYITGPRGGNEALDLAITDLKAPGFGFRDQEIQIDFKIKYSGDSSKDAEVFLKEKDNLISTKAVRLGSGKEVPVKFSFTPRTSGLKNYTLKVQDMKGEINKVNNVKNFQININRRKIRILYVSGQPSWEYSLFRRLVKSDWQVDLITFLILRNPENITLFPENELSLIRFPAREMFTKKIYSFDLLIYENFSYKKFFNKSYLTHIKKFVNQGGAFIMLGGKDSYANGGYIDTPIEDILPVQMESARSDWSEDKFKVDTGEKTAHPVLDIAGDAETSKEIWEQMPELSGYDASLRPKDGSTVLLKGPNDVPVLTLASSGKGRTAALNTHSTWRWCMGLSAEGKTPYYYNQFWYGLIRYLIQSSELNNIQVFPESERVNLGERTKINIKVVDRYWQEVNDAKLDVEINAPSSERVPAGAVQPSGKGGWYSVEVPVNEEGIYEVTIRGQSGKYDLGLGKAEFRGVKLKKELLNTTLNYRLLRNSALKSGGLYSENFTEKELNDLVKKAEKEMADSSLTERIFDFNTVPVYLLIAAIILFEWYLRRRRGML